MSSLFRSVADRASVGIEVGADGHAAEWGESALVHRPGGCRGRRQSGPRCRTYARSRALPEVRPSRRPSAAVCRRGAWNWSGRCRPAHLGCDFFVAGCHKWLLGPRGTGFVWGHPSAWPAATPMIPTFSDGSSPASAMTPGSFHSFEHRWALAQAFDLHRQLGRTRVTARIHALNRQLKGGLAAMPHVRLRTLVDENVSAGLVCFEAAGLSPQQVVDRLRSDRIIATVTPYATSYARLAAGVMNSPE